MSDSAGPCSLAGPGDSWKPAGAAASLSARPTGAATAEGCQPGIRQRQPVKDLGGSCAWPCCWTKPQQQSSTRPGVYHTSPAMSASLAAVDPSALLGDVQPNSSCSSNQITRQILRCAAALASRHDPTSSSRPARYLPNRAHVLSALPPLLSCCSTRRALPPRWRCRLPLRRPSAASTSALRGAAD